MQEAGHTIGFYVGWTVIPLLLLLFILATIVMLVSAFRSDDGDIAAGAFVFGFIVLCCLTLASFMFYPFGSHWHTWYRVTGAVEQIGSRQIADGESMSQRYVLRIKGHPYGVDDTRASLVKVGDTVTLMCQREWQFNADSGWACRWGKS